MINIIGIIVIILGFFIPFIVHHPAPSIFLFWIGFFLLLRENKFITIKSHLISWARIGLFCNISATLLGLLVSKLIMISSFSANYIAAILVITFFWISSPITQLSTIIMPYEQVALSNQAVGIQISFLRSTLTSFMDVLFYIVIFIVIGKFIVKKLKKD